MNQIPTIDDYVKAVVCPLRQEGGRRLTNQRKVNSGSQMVTVITIVKNRKDTLAKTIISVLNQSYPLIEYIIIDGASIDGTLEVIKQFNDKIDLWISEPDKGTSDAFNKAVSLSGGDFIFWLASDDWIDPDFIETAVKTFLSSGADFVFGNMQMYNNGYPVVFCEGNKNYVKPLMSGYPCFNFPTMVIKKTCFQKAGLIDMAYKFVADYELILRLHLKGQSGFYNSSLIVHRKVGGLGESHLVQSALEHFRLLKKYRLPKAKAALFYLYYFSRRIIGNFSGLFMRALLIRKSKELRREAGL